MLGWVEYSMSQYVLYICIYIRPSIHTYIQTCLKHVFTSLCLCIFVDAKHQPQCHTSYGIEWFHHVSPVHERHSDWPVFQFGFRKFIEAMPCRLYQRTGWGAGVSGEVIYDEYLNLVLLLYLHSWIWYQKNKLMPRDIKMAYFISWIREAVIVGRNILGKKMWIQRCQGGSWKPKKLTADSMWHCCIVFLMAMFFGTFWGSKIWM